jgi:hypothetical protein
MTTSRAGVGAAVLALSGLAVLGLQSPASAAPPNNNACPTGQHYAPKSSGCVNNGMSVGRRNLFPGQKQTVTLWGNKPDTSMRVTFAGETVGTSEVGPKSWVRVTFVVPKSTAPGTYRISAFGTAWNGEDTFKSLEVRVIARDNATAPQATTPQVSTSSVAAPLAVTDLAATNASSTSTPAADSGVQLVALAGAGLLLMGVGPTAVLVARRRRP